MGTALGGFRSQLLFDISSTFLEGGYQYILIEKMIHRVINTSSLIISSIKISSINITIRIIINLTLSQARHAAPDTEQHPQ